MGARVCPHGIPAHFDFPLSPTMPEVFVPRRFPVLPRALVAFVCAGVDGALWRAVLVAPFAHGHAELMLEDLH